MTNLTCAHTYPGAQYLARKKQREADMKKDRQRAREPIQIIFTLLEDKPYKKAIHVKNATIKAWLPKSKITYDIVPGSTNVVIIMPRWLAESRNLLTGEEGGRLKTKG